MYSDLRVVVLRGLERRCGNAASRALPPIAARPFQSSPTITTTTPRNTANCPVARLQIIRRSPRKQYSRPSSPNALPAAAMPTPGSELFLAKKPKVAPTFDGVDYEDNTALKGAQDAIIREQWVRSMMARLVRDEMGKCYRREGVNHLEKCGHLRGRSFSISRATRICAGRKEVKFGARCSCARPSDGCTP